MTVLSRLHLAAVDVCNTWIKVFSGFCHVWRNPSFAACAWEAFRHYRTSFDRGNGREYVPGLTDATLEDQKALVFSVREAIIRSQMVSTAAYEQTTD